LRSTWIYQVAHEQRLRIKARLKFWLSGKRSSWRRRWDGARRFLRREKQKSI